MLDYNNKRKGFIFILIVVFLSPFIIAIAVIYYIGASNSSKVESFFLHNECENIYNYKEQYKALCKNSIVIINDYFIIDFESNQKILYKDIDALEKSDKKVYITYSSLSSILEFEHKKDAKTFFINLEKRVKP